MKIRQRYETSISVCYIEGIEPWLDEEDLLPGKDWDFEIEKALETSDFVIVFLSTRWVEKVGYVQCEFRRALYHSEEMPEGFIHRFGEAE